MNSHENLTMLKDNSKTKPCRACGGEEFEILMDLGELPIAHRFLSSPEESEERFPFRIDYCSGCGLGQIREPIAPEILYLDYNYCFTSWKPEPHRADELKQLAALEAKDSVFEIGSNDGLFMEELCGMAGFGKCVGLEPNGPATQRARERGFEVYESFLERELIPRIRDAHGRFDLVASRQVLEHVQDLDLFFEYCRELLKDGGALFIDVPDVEPLLRAGDCTLAWEEHVNYFTEASLVPLLARQGFRAEKVTRYPFSGGCLSVLARKQTPRTREADRNMLDLMASFSERANAYAGNLRETLAVARQRFDQILMYGVGCRTCALVNGMNLGRSIDACIDDQPERLGKFLPGARLPIESPAARLIGGKKSLILLAVNEENEENVIKRASSLEGAGELSFLSVLGPTRLGEELREFKEQLNRV